MQKIIDGAYKEALRSNLISGQAKGLLKSMRYALAKTIQRISILSLNPWRSCSN